MLYEVITKQVGERIYDKITSTDGAFTFPDLSSMVSDYLKLKLRRNVQSWKTHKLPKIVTHVITSYSIHYTKLYDGFDEIPGSTDAAGSQFHFVIGQQF